MDQPASACRAGGLKTESDSSETPTIAERWGAGAATATAPPFFATRISRIRMWGAQTQFDRRTCIRSSCPTSVESARQLCSFRPDRGCHDQSRETTVASPSRNRQPAGCRRTSNLLLGAVGVPLLAELVQVTIRSRWSKLPSARARRCARGIAERAADRRAGVASSIQLHPGGAAPSGRLESVPSDERVESLHRRARECGFIANSVNCPVEIEP